MGGRDFRGELSALEAMLTQQRDVAVARLRSVHEQWARVLLGIEPSGDLVSQVRAAVVGGVDAQRAAQAAEQLGAAEERQWEIGTWASGSGEGLASMAAVRALQIAQAWIYSALSAQDPGALDRSRELVAAAEHDPNQMAARHADHIEALYRRLDEK